MDSSPIFRSGAKRSPPKKTVNMVRHANLDMFVGQNMRGNRVGSSSLQSWCVTAAPVSLNFV